MPGDVETAAAPHPAAASSSSSSNRPQRRGKIAAEIYKPPAARHHHHHHPQPPLQQQQQQQHSNFHRQQPRYNQQQKSQQQSQQHNVMNTSRMPADSPSLLQPAHPSQHPAAIPASSQPHPKQLQPSPSHQHLLNNSHAKSPRSHRRKPPGPRHGTAQGDRSSCPPEIVPAALGSGGPMPSQQIHGNDTNSNNGPLTQANNRAEVGFPKSNDRTHCSSVTPNTFTGSTVSDSNGNSAPQPQSPAAVTSCHSMPAGHSEQMSSGGDSPAVSTTAPLDAPAPNATSNNDLRNYLNNKREIQGQEIRNLSQTVELLSNKYFNNTASPYSRYVGNNSPNKSAISNPLNKNYVNEVGDPNNQFDSLRSGGHRQPADCRRTRPDQVLYVPRGRRQNGGGHTSDMNHYNNSRSSPLTEHYQNCRPPSPAFSITSIVSEFSGRNRYEGGYGQSISRPGSRISIYGDDDEKVSGKPPQYDRRNNSSRESTPGYGKPSAGHPNTRFNRQTLQLIDRCINSHESGVPSRRTSGMYDDGDVKEMASQQHNNSATSKSGQQYPNDRLGRASKSPTPNPDSVHSKENVMHPIESGSRRRRSRKNRKRRSQSRDHSFDSISKESGSLSNLSVGGHGSRTNLPLESSCTFYNSKFDSASVSLANSRNPSLERNPEDDWRQQKPVSYPNSPVKSLQQQPMQSPNKPSPGPMKNSPSSPSYPVSHLGSPSYDAPQFPHGSSLIHRRNSADKPPTGRPTSICNDRRDSFSKVSPPSSPTSETPQQLSPSKEFPASSCQSIGSAGTPNTIPEESSSADQPRHCDTQASRVPAVDQDVTETMEAELQQSCASIPTSPSPDTKCEAEPETDTFDELCSEYMSLDWAAETEKEDLRLQAAQSEESCTKDNSSNQQSARLSPVDRHVDDNTRKEITNTLGHEPSIEKSKQDYSKYQSSPPQRLLYSPPNERYSQQSSSKGGRYSPPSERYSPPRGTQQPTSNVGRYSPPRSRTWQASSNTGHSSGSNSPDGESPSGLAHVLELHDFPSSFRTQDLLTVYQGYQPAAPLDIKWVDDTHALVVFCTAAIAGQALAQEHPLIKARLLADASPASKSKAARIDEALLPARPRPRTSAVLARRLVSGALGVKVNVSREDREREAKTIRDAKDRKRQVAKQKEDVWEGNI